MSPSAYAEPSSWSVAQLVAAATATPPSAEALRLPRFQRHVVWTERQRQDFIDSVHKGFPIGSLLVFERPGSGFQLIDGLQRTSTLVHYAQDPLLYAPLEVATPEHVEQVRRQTTQNAGPVSPAKEAVNDAIRGGFLDWMRATKRTQQAAGFRADALREALSHRLEELQIALPQSADAVLYPILDDIKDQVSVDDMQIPVVKYRGDESHLPEIFERINTEGTKLSKYEIFAATWVDDNIIIANGYIRIAIDTRYRDLVDRGFRVEGLEGDAPISDFRLFEYLFGLGRLLGAQLPRMFRTRTDVAEEEPAAFTLTSVSLGLEVSEMRKLNGHMPRAADDAIDPTQLEEALLDAAQFVDVTLRPYIGLKLNEAGDKPLIAHADYQIQSLIGRTLVGRYRRTNGTFEERPGWLAEREIFRTTFPQHYLYDILRQTWRGAVASKFFERVWEGDADRKRVPSDFYLTSPTPRQWDDALEEWFSSQLDRRQQRRPHVRAAEKIFLKFLYAKRVTYYQDQAQTFELEHLFPVSRLAGLALQANRGWPISCIANLALFTKDLNRESSANTIKEFVDELQAGDPAAAHEVKEMLSDHLFCDIEDVNIPTVDGADSLLLSEYKAFLSDRWATMKGALLTDLGVEAVQGDAEATHSGDPV